MLIEGFANSLDQPIKSVEFAFSFQPVRNSSEMSDIAFRIHRGLWQFRRTCDDAGHVEILVEDIFLIHQAVFEVSERKDRNIVLINQCTLFCRYLRNPPPDTSCKPY